MMSPVQLSALHAFVVRAKKASYVSDAPKVSASRIDAYDLACVEGDWSYRDSYFGGTNFLGQEVV